jgi:hypothetical protein
MTGTADSKHRLRLRRLGRPALGPASNGGYAQLAPCFLSFIEQVNVLREPADVRANPWASVAGAPPGGSKCTRLACYKGANIWLCNDRNSFLKVRSYVIGDIVDQMTIDCHHVRCPFSRARAVCRANRTSGMATFTPRGDRCVFFLFFLPHVCIC